MPVLVVEGPEVLGHLPTLNCLQMSSAGLDGWAG
jgi:hypothetical protein